VSGAPASAHRFRLGPLLGRGAFGEVVRAFDRELGEWVALKRAHGGKGDEALASEHAALAAVRHPNVVRAGVWVEGAEWSGYSMALVEGPDARTWVRGADVERDETAPRRNLPMAFGQELQDVGDSRYRALSGDRLNRLRTLLRDLSEALDAVHAAGLLHLDVNPENVRVAGGRAVLLDLGLARPQGDSPSHVTLGSAAYGAPELGARPPTTASDFYSLGVLAFELLLGDRPFEGGGPEVLVRKQSLEASRPSELDAAVPPDLDTICAGLLQRLPSRRMNGAGLRAALAHIERPPVR